VWFYELSIDMQGFALTPACDFCSSETAKEVVRRELEILKTKDHWKKAYFYLWDEV
jgi:hypothetical protein